MFREQNFVVGLALVVVVGLVATVHQTAGDPDPAICVPKSTTPAPAPNVNQDPDFPTLPDKMRAWTEVKDVYDNFTYDVEWVFDNRRDTLKMAANVRSQGYTMHISYDFVTMQVIITSKDFSCQVFNMTLPDPAMYKRYGMFVDVVPLTLRVGNIIRGQAPTATDAQPIFSQDGPTYQGMATVRNIPVQIFTTCIYYSYPAYGVEGTMYGTMYFSKPGYMMPSAQDQLPVIYEVLGSINISQTMYPVNQTRFPYSVSMDYFDVVVGPVTTDRAFEPPLGVVCPGRISEVPFPTDWPETFSLNVEVQSWNTQRYQTVREYYSYPDNIIAYEYQNWGETVGSFMRTVHDYNYGLAYDLSVDTGVCNIGPIPVNSGEAISPDGQHVLLASIKSFLNLKSLNWVYEGQSYQRGILTESWIVFRTDWPESAIADGWQVNSTWEYFFAADNWQAPAKYHRAVSHLPVLLTLAISIQPPGGSTDFPYNMTWIYHEHIFGIYLEPFAPALTDVSTCYDSSDSMELAFDFADKFVFDQYVVNNTNSFYLGVIRSVAIASNVTFTRITQPLVVQGNSGLTTFYYKLLGTPPVDGNAYNITEQTSLNDAYNKFSTAVGSGFQVSFRYQGETTNLKVDSDSLRQDFSTPSGFSAGAMAGMAVGMFAAGVLICVVIGVVLRQTSTGPFSYKTQT